MRALSLALLLSAAAVASAHAQDRYSARGIVVVRDAPPASAPVSAPAPSSDYAAPASLRGAPAQDPAAAERPMTPPSHYLSWPGKGQPRATLTSAAVRSDPTEGARGRFAASAAAPASTLASRQARPDRAAAYSPPAVVYAAPPPRPVAQQSIYDSPPAQPRQAYAAPARLAAPAPTRAMPYPPASALTYTRTAPPRMPDAAPIEVASATPAASPKRSSKATAVKVMESPARGPVQAQARHQAQLAKAPARDEVKPSKTASRSDVLVPVATAKEASTAAFVPASAAARTPPVRMIAASEPSMSGSPRQGGATARFYSVGRQYGETPDPIVMPKQFFLDGSPDMAAPPPLPIPRIAPTAGKSTAVQRAAAENSQTDPDAPVD